MEQPRATWPPLTPLTVRNTQQMPAGAVVPVLRWASYCTDRQTDSSKDTEHSCSKIQQGSYSILREVESVTGEGHVREEKDREGPS